MPWDDGLRSPHLLPLFCISVLLVGLLLGGMLWTTPSAGAPLFPDDLIITEVMPDWSNHPTEGLLITKVYRRGDTVSWVELYNPQPDTFVLQTVSHESDDPDDFVSLDVSVGPGAYLYVCHWRDCGRPYQQENRSIERMPGMTLAEWGGLSIWSHRVGDVDVHGGDRVGWGSAENRQGLEGRPASALTGNMALVRRKDERGCPVDTGNNRKDFRTVSSEPNLGGYASCPGATPDNSNAYVEIYNPTDQPIDPVARGYSLINARHPDESPNEYELVGFPHYPHSQNTALKPDQVGIVLAMSADTLAFDDLPLAALPEDWKTNERLEGTFLQRAHTGEIHLYTLRRKDTGDHEFFRTGLSANPLRSVTLLQPFTQPGSRLVSRALINPDNPGVPEMTGAERPTVGSSDTMAVWYVREYGTAGRYSP